MTKVAFQKLVEEAAQLQSEIAEKSRRLETVKAQIAAEIAKQPKVETTATDGGGQTFRVESKSGVGIRVTQPAPQLIRSFSPELIEKIKALAGRSFGKLFVVKYSTVPKFREKCLAAVKDNAIAKKIIALCEMPSMATVTVG